MHYLHLSRCLLLVVTYIKRWHQLSDVVSSYTWLMSLNLCSTGGSLSPSMR
jgi:hypothetical protein